MKGQNLVKYYEWLWHIFVVKMLTSSYTVFKNGLSLYNLFYQYLLSAPSPPQERMFVVCWWSWIPLPGHERELIKTPDPRVPQARRWVRGLSTHSPRNRTLLPLFCYRFFRLKYITEARHSCCVFLFGFNSRILYLHVRLYFIRKAWRWHNSIHMYSWVRFHLWVCIYNLEFTNLYFNKNF